MSPLERRESDLLFLESVLLRHLGPLPGHELFHYGLERRHRNTNLLHAVTIANRDLLVRRLFFIADGLNVNGDTERRAHFVLPAIESADGGRVVVHRVPAFP